MAEDDVLVDIVNRLQAHAGSRGNAPADVWNHTCGQLLGLMNNYPGGVSTPVLETHLWSQSLSVKVRRHAAADT